MPTIRELRVELGRVNDLLADARARETASILAAFKEQVELYEMTEQEVLVALGFVKQRGRRYPAKYYDPNTGKKWSGQGSMPKWLRDKNPDDFLVAANGSASRHWWPGES